jgi:DNA-binding HxlR family transcriptional regulator
MLKRRLNHVPPPPERCALALCLHYISGAWTANVLWYLGHQPRRFTELKADLPGVSSKVLTQRLRRLERDGLVQRNALHTSPPSVEYALTELGRELQPALAALVAVGHRIKLESRPHENGRSYASLRNS